MKCIMCKLCEEAKAALDKKLLAWLDAHANKLAVWEREADQERIHHVHSLLLKTDPARGLKEYLALAEQGSVWSMAHVGAAFQKGIGTAPNPAQAEKWLRRAYENGSDHGLLWLGHLYLGSQEYAKAEEVFRTGVARGCVPAMYRLAWTYSKSSHWPEKRDEALALLERASAAGDLSAKYCLAMTMARGWFGLRRIPSGIRLIFRVVDEMAELIKDEQSAAGKRGSKAKPTFFGRLARFYPLFAVRILAS